MNLLLSDYERETQDYAAYLQACEHGYVEELAPTAAYYVCRGGRESVVVAHDTEEAREIAWNVLGGEPLFCRVATDEELDLLDTLGV